MKIKTIQSDITCRKMRILAILLLFVPSIAFAAAGFADAYNNHQRWIFPAYAYCLAFGLVVLLSLFIISRIYKQTTRHILECISSYLMQHKVLAIVFTGILLSIPTGILGDVSWEIIWFLSIYPFMGLAVVFPIILVNKRFREKVLLSTFWIKWSIFIALSSITASLLFIILTDCNLLAGTDLTYFVRHYSYHQGLYFPTHPYDSMKEIWTMPAFFACETVIALILYSFGVLNRFIYRKLSALRRRKEDFISGVGAK